MKIAIVIGSIRSGRQSHKIGLYLEEKLRQQSIGVDLIDLLENPLPLLGERAGHHFQAAENVQTIGHRLAQADALLLVTPEYHGSFSGILKNALDYFWAEFQKKPIGVVTVSTGKMGGINASTQLQHVILSMGAYPVPLKLLIPEVQSVFNESLQITNERIAKSAEKFLDEFLWFTDAIVHAKTTAVQRVIA